MTDRQPPSPPPSRHPGSRVVTKTPDLVRAIVGIRKDVETAATRVRRQDLAFVPAAVTSGVPCTSDTFTATHKVMVYRSGHTIYADLAAGVGTGSSVEARLTVPDLGLVGGSAVSGTGGNDVDLRVSLALPDAWRVGEPHRVYVEARRASGADATTVQVLAAWQR